MIPLLILQTAAIALGVGLWVASLTVKYRDFQHLINFVIQLWMYATPIIYPASAIPENWRFIMGLNPMAGIVESFRYAFFGVGYIQPHYLLLSFLVTTILLISGLFYFNKTQRTFVDTI